MNIAPVTYKWIKILCSECDILFIKKSFMV